MRVRVLVPMLALLAVGPAGAAGLGAFYLRGAEGWFWYALPPAEAEVVVTPVEPAPAPEPPPPAVSDLPSGPVPLSTAWLREHLPRFRDAAIDEPTPTRVALYLYLQRAALDRASRFAEVAQRVALLDPQLDETTRRPTATFAANAVNRQAGAAREAVLEQLAADTGLLFFFRADCPYCELQAPLLQTLARRYGFTVYPVSLDGAGLPGGLFPSYRVDRGQARVLGVVATPALFLARPPDGVVPLAQGVLSLEQLKERLVLAADEAGWLAEEDVGATRAWRGDLRLALDAARAPAALPEAPEALLAYLRALARSEPLPVVLPRVANGEGAL